MILQQSYVLFQCQEGNISFENKMSLLAIPHAQHRTDLWDHLSAPVNSRYPTL